MNRADALSVEDATLFNAGFRWSPVSNTWVRDRPYRTLVWANCYPRHHGPRWWCMEWFPETYYGRSGMQQTAPAFGNLDSLLLWAKLEGLL